MTKKRRSSFLYNSLSALVPLLSLTGSVASAQLPSRELSVSEDSAKVTLLNRKSPPRYLTSSVSYVSGEELSSTPGGNRLNSLTGRLPGLSVLQEDGLPGTETSTMLIRGIHSFRGSNTPLVLINGRRDDVAMLEPHDIESVTILKDAAATALYGMNSTNGVVLITTKRGHEGGIRVNFNHQTSVQQPTRLPKFLDAADYATLYNEALTNDGSDPRYTPSEIEAFRSGSDPYRYPNVDWSGEFLRKQSLQVRNNLNVSGGNKVAKYFFSGSYLTDGGIFNVDKPVNTYNTNTNIGVLNARANVEINIGRNITLSTDIRAKRDKKNAPGAYSASYDDALFGTIYSTPAAGHPIRNADGSLAGTNDYRNNPYGLLNLKGYSNYLTTSFSNLTELSYNLDDVVKGLKLKGHFGFSNYTQFYVNRTKNFEVYQLNANGNGYNKIGLDSPIASSGSYDQIMRIYDHSISLDYERTFGKHALSGFVSYRRDQIDNNRQLNLTQNFQGPRAFLSYRFNNRYLLDLTAAYEGSEQYPKGSRYGFFPAVSAGWIVSEENFLSDTGIDFLKLRGSHGRTGKPANTYFEYMSALSQASGSGGVFGTTPAASIGISETKIANPLITWERTLKTNVGVDLAVLRNRLQFTADYFNGETTNILIANAITSMYGAAINSPSGTLKNKGWESRLQWNDRVKDFTYFVDVHYASAKNTITYMAEQYREHPWMYQTGHPVNTRTGYVFDRFFTESDDLSKLPNQSVLGAQRPGDLKYKDLNGDNVIDENDITQIGYAKIPQINYGAQVGVGYKGFDVRALFQGTSNSTTYNSGGTYWEFVNRTGNAAQHHMNRWTPGAEQSAGYPRLTLSNRNNFVNSSYWVQDNSFVRLKFLEVGYNFPEHLAAKAKMKGARVFLNGHNLAVWDKVKHKDPEIQDNGIAYPILRSFSIGLNAKF
jgi:TonB-linked SusC/RagA family outer membrane protein